jgi:hypothetical protein
MGVLTSHHPMGLHGLLALLPTVFMSLLNYFFETKFVVQLVTGELLDTVQLPKITDVH